MFQMLLNLLVPVALAQGPCWGIACGAGGNPLPAFVTVIAVVLLEIASGFAVVAVVVGGAFMLMNFGNESQAERGKKGIMYGLVAFAIALSSQAIVSFTVSKAVQIDRNAPHLSLMRVTINSVLVVFNVVFALMMLYFAFKLILSKGQQSEMDTFKKGIGWSIAGALAVNLSYALVRATAQLGF